jgi:membrane protein required for colicin V production
MATIMHLLDFIILFFLLLFAIGGIRRGLVWELLTTLGLILGLVATYFYRTELIGIVANWVGPGWQQQWAVGLVFLVFFLIIYIGFTFIGHAIHAAIEKTPFKWPDRLLGIVAGVAKGIMILAFFVTAVEFMDPSGQARSYLDHSKLIRWGKQAAYSVTHWESDEIRSRV